LRKSTRVSLPSLIEKAINTLRIVQKVGVRKESLKAISISPSSFNNVFLLANYQSEFASILDVGANIGQFALAASCCFPEAKIYCFEPIPSAFVQLKKNIKRNPQIKAFNCALGNCPGKARFYESEYTQVSSLYRIDKRNDNPNFDQDKTVPVDVDICRLDDVYPTLNIKAPVLLKMDVQGMEKEVLLGSGTALLKITEFVLLEVPFIPLYEHQLLFDDLNDYMRSLGYKLLAPIGMNKGKHGMIIEMDILYRRD
jgi:FkbM family methyltransferase